MTSTPSNNGDLPPLLTTAEATQFLWGKSGRSAAARLYRAAADKRIASIRLSGRHWWPLKNLELMSKGIMPKFSETEGNIE
jgi:hypothetical protein